MFTWFCCCWRIFFVLLAKKTMPKGKRNRRSIERCADIDASKQRFSETQQLPSSNPSTDAQGLESFYYRSTAAGTSLIKSLNVMIENGDITTGIQHVFLPNLVLSRYCCKSNNWCYCLLTIFIWIRNGSWNTEHLR